MEEDDKSEQDFYKRSSQKVWDFIKGFIGNCLVAILYFGIYWLVALFLESYHTEKPSYLWSSLSIVLPVLLIIFEVWLIKNFLKFRRYIGIGMLSSLMLPLLVSGACSLVFFNIGINH